MKTTAGHDSEPLASPPALAGAVPPAPRSVGVGAGGPPPAVAAAPPAAAAGVDLMSLLHALRKHWMLIFVLVALGVPTVAGLTYYLFPRIFPDKYTARALLQIAQETPRVLGQTAEAQTKFEVLQNTQTQLIKSRSVLDLVLADEKIAMLPTVQEQVRDNADPYDWLSRQLIIDFQPNSEIVAIALSGSRPDNLAALVNKVVEVYMREVVKKQENERTKRLDELKSTLDLYQKDMAAKREKLRSSAVRAGSDNPRTLAVKQQLAQQKLALIEQEQFKLKSQIMQLTAEANARYDQPAEVAPQVDPAALDQHVERVAEVKKARDDIALLQHRYENARRLARKANDPSLSRTRHDLDEALRELETLRAEARTQILQQFQSGTTGAPTMDKARLDQQIRMFKDFAQQLETEAERLRNDNREQNETTLDIQSDQDEIARMAEITQRVGQEAQLTQVELKAPQRVTKIDDAKTPRTVDSKKKLQVTAMASLGTLAFILFGVSFWEIRARRINSVDQVINSLGLRVVGALPALPTPGRKSSGLMRSSSGPDWQSLLVESVDATRAMLLYASRTDNVRVVVVTSAQMGEGKTSLASHLAASLARAGRSTLLIDCDLRRPAIHRLFDLPLGPGVSELLRGEVSPAQVLQPSPANHLTILTAGQADEQSMEAIGRGDLEQIFETLKAQFDFLIIDSAPVLPVADTLLLSQHADAAIFSIMHDVSRVPLVQAAYERLASLGVPILGAVVAGTSDRTYYGSNSYDYHSPKTTAQAS